MTAKRGTAPLMTGSYAEFQAVVLRAMSRDIDSDVAFGQTQSGKLIVCVLRKALAPKSKTVGSTYLLSVDYDLSVEEAVDLGCYGWSNPNINSKYFPTKQKGKAEVAVELVHLNRVVSTREALRELDSTGYRPADLRELLSFGEKHPEAQREFPIVALGSVWRHRDGDRRVPYLSKRGSGRRLYLGWVGHDWHEFFRFASIRK